MEQIRAGIKAAVERYLSSGKAVALTGAGISVDCGIPDFRSPGGVWEEFAPEEYATLDAFISNPSKAWVFYRALGKVVRGRSPGPAHQSLARLESAGLLKGIVTQNIDGLHHDAGSHNVVEVHGNYRTLHCLYCHHTEPLQEESLHMRGCPRCKECRSPLKPDVVLFGEQVRHIEKAEDLLKDCDMLLVVGTSASVYPSALFPGLVLNQGGSVVEFNRVETHLSSSATFRIRGRVDSTVPLFTETLLKR